jgi:VanZ family protein
VDVWLRRTVVAAMFGLAIGPVVLATTYPFRPRMERAWVAWKLHSIDWRPATRRINYDTVQNLLLMMPLGLAIVCAGRRRRIRRTTVEAASAALLLSVSVEAAQIVLPGRYPQLVDVVNNVAGCTAAAVWVGLWRAARERRLAAGRA